MMNSKRAFTLIELLIVIAIIGVMSGTVSKLWFGMEKMKKSTHRNVLFTCQGQRVLDRIKSDIRQSLQADFPPGSLIQLSQLSAQGTRREIVYFIDEKELIREIREEGTEARRFKVANLEESWLEIERLDSSQLWLVWKQEEHQRPLEIRLNRLVSIVTIKG